MFSPRSTGGENQSPTSARAAYISTATYVLANLALQLGRPLAYDPAARSIPGDGEATNLLRQPYRLPWIHPDPDQV